jgi:CheY-like chemotaxis protein
MTVIFIDDDADDTALFCEVIYYLSKIDGVNTKKENVECIQINDSRNVVGQIAALETMPDCIFIDMHMPMISGRECLEEIKAHGKYSGIPVIILSTALRENDVLELKTIGAVDCAVKPVTFAALTKMFALYVYGNVFTSI